MIEWVYKLTIVYLLLFMAPVASCLADTGVIVALNVTLQELLALQEMERVEKVAGRELYQGRLYGEKVVVVRSPMGKVNNALTVQLLLSNRRIDRVVSFAPCGALDQTLAVGDVVVASKVYQHDFGTVKPYGFVWNRVPDGTASQENGYNVLQKSVADQLVSTAFPRANNRLRKGVIVTGDQFISSDSKRQWLLRKFNAIGVDTGAAAIAQVCYASRVPLVAVRIVTDHAGVSARADFRKSVPGYRSDIDIKDLLRIVLTTSSSIPHST